MNPQGLQQLECLEALAPNECMLPSDWMWRAGVTTGLALDTCLPGPAAGSPEFPRNNTIWHKISAASEFPTYFILQCILVTPAPLPLISDLMRCACLLHRRDYPTSPTCTRILIPRRQIKHRFRSDLSGTNSITTNLVVSQSPWLPRKWERLSYNVPEVCPRAGSDFWLKDGFRRLGAHSFSLVPTEHVWDVEACGILGHRSSGSVCVTQHATAKYRILLHEVMETWARPEGRPPAATTLTFGQNTLCQSPHPPTCPISFASATQTGKAYGSCWLPTSCLV